MFVYLLIGAELAIIWGVFWYLYVREPAHRSHINPSLWGGYTEGDEPYVDPYIADLERHRGDEHELKAYVQTEEFIWDSRSNRYIPVAQHEAQKFLSRLAAKLDRQFSQLNVRP